MSEAGPGPSVAQRWQRLILRFQGRLDTDSADRLIPWLSAAVLFVVLVALDAAALRALDGGSGTAAWVQAAWRRRHGGVGAPVAGADPATGAWSLVAEPILWLSRFVPAEAVFSVVQAGAIAVAIVPLWKLARDEAHLRVGAAATAVAAFALAPTLHRTNLSSFHPEAIALPALLWAYLHGSRGHLKRYCALVLLIVACRADLGITVAALGLLLASVGRRRLGLASAAGGLAWSIIAVIALHPRVPDSALTPSGEFVARTIAPLATFGELFTRPLGELGGLLAESSVAFLVVVLSPLLFLPLVSPRRLAAAAPCLALAMMSDRAVQRSAQAGVVDLAPAGAHIAPAMAFVFIALVFALERIGTLGVTRINVDRRVLVALLAGSALLFVAAAPSSPYRRPWSWGSQDATDGARLEAASMIDASAAVAVSPQSTVVVAERADLVELAPQPSDLTRPRIQRVAERVDAVLLDTSGIEVATREPSWPSEQRRRVLSDFAQRGFAVTYEAEGIYLLEPSARRTGSS